MAVGGHSPWVSRLAHDAGLEVIVANPRRVQLITSNERKNDRTDAELFARLGRVDPQLVSLVMHRSTRLCTEAAHSCAKSGSSGSGGVESSCSVRGIRLRRWR